MLACLAPLGAVASLGLWITSEWREVAFDVLAADQASIVVQAGRGQVACTLLTDWDAGRCRWGRTHVVQGPERVLFRARLAHASKLSGKSRSDSPLEHLVASFRASFALRQEPLIDENTGVELTIVYFPLWVPFLLFSYPPCIRLARRCFRRWRREITGYCVCCGYNLTGNTSGVCPECGSPAGVSPAGAPCRPEEGRGVPRSAH